MASPAVDGAERVLFALPADPARKRPPADARAPTWLTDAVPPPSDGPRRPRDRAATRQALLDAARTLFAERGYDRTTLRQVAERAGVDAALVARYFGGKEGLFLAVFASESLPDPAEGPERLADTLISRWDEVGPGPMVHALLRPELDEAVRARMLEAMEERIVAPAVAALQAAGVPDARLRAELLLAGLVGVGVVRKGGGFAALSAASRDEVLQLLRLEFDALGPR